MRLQRKYVIELDEHRVRDALRHPRDEPHELSRPELGHALQVWRLGLVNPEQGPVQHGPQLDEEEAQSQGGVGVPDPAARIVGNPPVQVRHQVAKELEGMGAVRGNLAGPHVMVRDAGNVGHPNEHRPHPVQILLGLEGDLELVEVLNVLQGLDENLVVRGGEICASKSR